MKQQQTRPTEVITFQRGDQLATVVTDGVNHRTYEWEYNRSHASITAAMAYLESRGYSIVPGYVREGGRW